MPAPSQHERILGVRVRGLILTEIDRIFSMDPSKLGEGEAAIKKDLLLRMAPNALPRVTEVSGPNGGPIETKQITGMVIQSEQPNGDFTAGQNNIQDEKPETNTSS